MVSKTVNTFNLRTQMTSSVMSSNIDKVLNNTPVTSNIQNVLFTATTTSPNTMHEIHSKVSPVMPIYTSLAPVLSSNITARKPTKESSLSTVIFSAKVNLEETPINREDIKTFHFLKLPKGILADMKKGKLVKQLQTPERTHFELIEVKKM